MSLSPNQRNTIDDEVYKWVMSQQDKKKKVVTPNTIRQRAFELGQDHDPHFKASLNWYNNWKKRYDYNESPEADALKHKKRSYTAAFKLHAVQRAVELESASQASLELNVSRRCLQRWKEELDLIASVAEHSSNAVYRRPGQGRKVHDSNLDTQLLDWVKESWKQNVNITSGMVREKARQLSTQGSFKASLGWFVKWQKRNCVDLKAQSFNSPVSDNFSPLRLRLLPEGEVSCYSASRKPKSKRRKLSYDDEALLENDEEFDRLLLTWLVERWEAGDIVNDRMLKDRAMELTANPEFKASKIWLHAWKRKYNVSLENQTYGNEEGEENEEIVEESEVYDNEVLLEEQQAASRTEKGGENPLTPTKEEAATTLASLSAEDHEAAGLEIAEALQKLADAIGITTQGGEGAKEAMAQLAAAYQADNPDFLLESAGNVVVEEVISEEVVTDEAMVVIEAGAVDGGQSSTEDTVAMVPGQSPQGIVTEEMQSQAIGSEINIQVSTEVSTQSVDITVQSQAQISTPDNTLIPANTIVSTSPISSYVSEEVVIGEPVIETSTIPSVEGQVEVLVHGSEGIILFPSQDTTVIQSSEGQDIIQSDSGDQDIFQSTAGVIQSRTTLSQSSAVPTTQDLLQSAAASILQGGGGMLTPITTTGVEISPPTSTEVSSPHVVSMTSDDVSFDQVEDDGIIAVAQAPEIPIPVASQEILDIVQETIASSGERTMEESPTRRMYDEDFKARVVSRAQELGSIQQAAREFSVPWRAVATWNTQGKQKD